MRVIMLFACLSLVAVNVSARDTKFTKAPLAWAPVAALQAPALPPDMPAAAAGCVVIGHHILADGTTAKPRVMQGAFTSDVSPQAQADFQGVALAVVDHWRFRHVGRDGEPSAAFNSVVVGFHPAQASEATRAVVGIESQDARVRQACKLGDLADWGNSHAIPVEQAIARKDDRMLLKAPDHPDSYWTILGDMTPPHYPVAAVKSGVEACIVVGFRIGADGVPGDHRVMSSSLNGVKSSELRKQFEDVSIHAASTWRYAPGPDNLARVPEFMQTPVDFHLGSAPQAFTCKVVDLAGDERKKAQ